MGVGRVTSFKALYRAGDQIMDFPAGVGSPDDPTGTGSDSLIGTTGAQVSYGCVHLHDGDLAQLAPIPPGTPIDIVA